MGHNVNWDRKHAPPSAEAALTLAEMKAAGWTVRAVCLRCGVRLRVDLDRLVRQLGGNEILWGRRSPCKVEGCDGQVVFSARAVRGGSWVAMGKPPGDLAITAFAERLKRRYRPARAPDRDELF